MKNEKEPPEAAYVDQRRETETYKIPLSWPQDILFFFVFLPCFSTSYK